MSARHHDDSQPLSEGDKFALEPAPVDKIEHVQSVVTRNGEHAAER